MFTSRLATYRPLQLHSHAARFLSVMPSNNMDAPNASGLTPNESKSLEERSPKPHEEGILQRIKEVCKAHGCARHTKSRSISCTAADRPRRAHLSIYATF